MVSTNRSYGRGRPMRLVAQLLTLLLAACGGGSYSGGNMGPPLAPTVTISIAPATITLGQSATLTWSTMNASTCTASSGWTGNESTSGSQTVTPTGTGNVTYTLSCTAPAGGSYSGGGGGQTSMSATLMINPASAFSFTTLVSDTAGTGALVVDPNLKNPWGVVFGSTTPVWVANNHMETSTLYDGNGKPQPATPPLVVNTVPTGTVTFDPTGIVFSGSATDFMVSAAGKSGPARFIFTGEGGMIAGWSPAVDVKNTVTMYPAAGADSGGAIYKGLAIAKNGTASFLYATDFHNNKVDVFDATFVKQTPAAGAFVDSKLPAGYAPYGIQAIANGAGGAVQIYVAYAKQDAEAHDNVNGAGLGIIDIFDASGTFIKQLIPAGGALNAPWGMALAPADFGTLSKMLLIGNFGDGKINSYDPATGVFVGAITDSAGAAFAMPGLWGIAFGNDNANQPHNTLFFAAGLNGEANGSYGRIDLGAPPTLNAPPVVALTVPAGNLTGTVALSATVQDPIAIAKVQFFANTSTLLGTAAASPYTVQWDTTAVANGAVSITAVATDNDGNVGMSAATMATIAN